MEITTNAKIKISKGEVIQCIDTALKEQGIERTSSLEFNCSVSKDTGIPKLNSVSCEGIVHPKKGSK
jgi:hypothetical protein